VRLPFAAFPSTPVRPADDCDHQRCHCDCQHCRRAQPGATSTGPRPSPQAEDLPDHAGQVCRGDVGYGVCHGHQFKHEQLCGFYENSPLAGYSFAFETDAVPNGAYGEWYFTNADGSVGTSATTATGKSQRRTHRVCLSPWAPPPRRKSTSAGIPRRNCYLPPFIFGDAYELSTGLFGVQNFQVQMNMTPSPLVPSVLPPSILVVPSAR